MTTITRIKNNFSCFPPPLSGIQLLENKWNLNLLKYNFQHLSHRVNVPLLPGVIQSVMGNSEFSTRANINC